MYGLNDRAAAGRSTSGKTIVYRSVTKLKLSLQGANFIQNCRGNSTISAHLNAKKPLMRTKGRYFTLKPQKC